VPWDCDAELSAFYTTACSRRPRSPWRNRSPLRSRWLGPRSEEECGSHHILAGRAKDWGVVIPFVLDDMAIDVPGVASSLVPVPAGGLVLDQGLVKVAEAYVLFLESGLQHVELLEVGALSSCGG